MIWVYNKCGQKCGQIKKELDDKTYVLTFNTLAEAGGFAKPRSKQQSAGLLLAAFGQPTCSNPTSSSTKKDPQPQLRISFGGSWWIRTTEALSSRFTVCPHWPLGKAPIFIFASALTALDYYSRIRWKKQALFQKYFCKWQNGKQTPAVASALQTDKNNTTPKETA